MCVCFRAENLCKSVSFVFVGGFQGIEIEFCVACEGEREREFL